MTVQTATSYPRNGKHNGVAQAGDPESPKFWQKIQINEWTFSLFLFVISLAIVAGKLFVNYGHTARWSPNVRYSLPSLSAFLQVPDVFALSDPRRSSGFDRDESIAAGYRTTNVSHEYGRAVAGMFAGISHRCGWLLRAASCGLAMMGFTWFIIYKDSCIPGINPPMPFSPSKTKYPEKPRLQINYLVGVLNGILIFVYMCL